MHLTLSNFTFHLTQNLFLLQEFRIQLDARLMMLHKFGRIFIHILIATPFTFDDQNTTLQFIKKRKK